MLKWKSLDKTKNVILAIEPENADEFLKRLKSLFVTDDQLSFEVVTYSNQLTMLREPDVLVLSRFLPDEKPTEILKYVAENFSSTHVVLLSGDNNEQGRQYIRFAKSLGFKNIVTGDLPGDGPYTIDLAIKYTLPEVLGQQQNQQSVLIASTANKGGVGKTTTAIALAEVLAQKVPTVLCDFDFTGSDILSFYSLKPQNYFETDINPVRINDNLYVLPAPENIIPSTIKDNVLVDIVNELSKFQVIVVDTPPSPWEKPYLHELLSRCDLVYSIVDQSLFSVDETKRYAPTLLAMGVTPDKIRIIVNRYTPKHASINSIEQAFCSGFKKHVKTLPRVTATIPEDWESQLKAAYQGKVLNVDIWENVCTEIFGILGIEYVPEPPPRRLLDIFKKRS